MSERMKTIVAVGVSAVALIVVVAGLAGSEQPEPTADERVAALAASIKCPFCSGESLAESPSSVAADYRDLIAVRVAAGNTDDEIRQEFADNFGESFILDSSTSSWSVVLWIAPALVLMAGVVAIFAMRRAAQRSEVGS